MDLCAMQEEGYGASGWPAQAAGTGWKVVFF